MSTVEGAWRHINKPRTIDALKDAIRLEVAAITDVTLPEVFASLHTHSWG
jgi:hypothetical protein